jgi:hypothetical protein
MERTGYEMVRNAVDHANLLLSLAARMLEGECLNSDQDITLTQSIYKTARTAEALADTLKEAAS